MTSINSKSDFTSGSWISNTVLLYTSFKTSTGTTKSHEIRVAKNQIAASKSPILVKYRGIVCITELSSSSFWSRDFNISLNAFARVSLRWFVT